MTMSMSSPLIFSDAFDSVRHHRLASKAANIPMPCCLYKWIVNNLSGQQHQTKRHGAVSSILPINASVILCSALRPAVICPHSFWFTSDLSFQSVLKIRWWYLPFSSIFNNNNNNNNTSTMFMVLSSCLKHWESSPWFTRWVQHGARWPPTFGPTDRLGP